MIRPSLLAIAVLLMASPAAGASVEIQLGLPANNGLYARVANFEQITLEIERKGRFVTYEVPGEVTETGLKVRFGELGLIDVAFKPTETRTDKPPKGCRGRPSKLSEGLFVGTIEFTGEREYVRIETTQAEGTLNIWRESEWRCSDRERPMRTHTAMQTPALRSRRQSEAEKEPAILAAGSRGCNCFFAAYTVRDRKGHGSSDFVGAQFEDREGMEITRSTFVEAGSSAFVFNHTAGTARVHPPPPFSGHGAFKRRLHSRDLWRSTIQVPLLGADPLRIGDPGFRARLVRAFPGGR